MYILIPGSKCIGSAEPEECRDLKTFTGVLLGDTNGEAGGDCIGPPPFGDIGWNE